MKATDLSVMLRWTCCLCTEGQVVHTLPEGPPVAGVTTLGEQVYVLRHKERDQVEVYDVITYWLQQCLTVPNIHGFADMTSCEHSLCLYISDPVAGCIHRLGLRGHFVALPRKPSLCIHPATGSEIYKHRECSHEVMSANP